MNNPWKKDFPILNRMINDKPLVYFDNAATSQIPKQVLDAVYEFETNHRANVHRGVHTLSEEATDLYEKARKTIAGFINAIIPEEIVFVRNSTEAINTVAYSWARANLNKGDIVLVSEAEHHSNLIPWQRIAMEKGIILNFIPVNEDGFLDIKSTNTDWEKVKLVAITHVSNVFGVINDVNSIKNYIKGKVFEAHRLYNNVNELVHPRILLDASQSVPHMPVDVRNLGVDFLTFSGHKMCSPMGIGVLWVNRERFKEMDVFNTGGGMINSVSLESSTFAVMPEMLEAGTPNVTGAIGLAAGAKYLQSVGFDNIVKQEKILVEYAMKELAKDPAVRIIGSIDPLKKVGVIAFTVENIASHDLAAVLDSEGVAVRSGHHCVMPWHVKHNLTATTRASFYFYNDVDEIDVLVRGIEKAKRLLLRG